MNKEQVSTSSKYRAVESVLSGAQSAATVAKAFGVSRSTLYRWIERYESDHSLNRKSVSGRPSKINDKVGKKILAILSKPASNFGYESDFWTTRRIAQVVKKN